MNISLKQRLMYLTRSALKTFQRRECPYCNGHAFRTVDKKYGVTSLLRCEQCELLHRHPRDTADFFKKFYQSEYEVDVQMMTDLPNDAELARLKAQNFSELRDYAPVIGAAAGNASPSSLRVHDYGCSWGYNIFKLRAAGMDASGYELSVPRASFGAEKLDIPLTHDTALIPGDNDVFFSSHAIEHLADLRGFIALAQQKLKQEGVFMAFCPNGSPEYQQRDPETFHVTWGNIHPLYLTVDFARHLFSDCPYLILTSDWPHDIEAIAAWDDRSQSVIGPRDGNELLIISKPNISLRA